MDVTVSFVIFRLFLVRVLISVSFSDVVFVEDVRSIPVGRVLKVDGQYAAVRFPPANGTEIKDEPDWQDCRLMKKDDLQVRFLLVYVDLMFD